MDITVTFYSGQKQTFNAADVYVTPELWEGVGCQTPGINPFMESGNMLNIDGVDYPALVSTN